MERFKQTIAKLEGDVAELRQFQTKIQGSTQSKGDIHYCTSSQEFGEYSLDEIDTFRFSVSIDANQQGNNNILTYTYTLTNPTHELIRFCSHPYNTKSITSVDPDNFEKMCMKNENLSNDIRKSLDSKLWEFAVDPSFCFINAYTYSEERVNLHKDIRRNFFTDITIPFTNTYKISPHVSFYVTPILHSLDECLIKEITTKQVIFHIKYGNSKGNAKTPNYNTTIFSDLKLHYSIIGIVEQTTIDTLLD